MGERSVREFFFSPRAAEIDSALGLADELVPEEATTRLLSLPEYKTEALWFITSEAASEGEVPRLTSRVIVISAPPSFSGRVRQLISAADFLRALAGTSLGMGLLFPA